MKTNFSKEKFRYLFYTVSHPMDGYYWIRHTDKGSVPIAILLVILFAFSFSFNRLYASFVVNGVNPSSVNSITELSGVLLFYLLLCVSNWSVTCLLNGEGRMKDIAIAVGYGMVPFILSFNIGTILSLSLSKEEGVFYWLVLGAGIAYGVIMLLVGIMQVHNYTVGKTLITLFLTVIAAFIIIFITLLFINLMNQIYGFFRSIYLELVFRT